MVKHWNDFKLEVKTSLDDCFICQVLSMKLLNYPSVTFVDVLKLAGSQSLAVYIQQDQPQEKVKATEIVMNMDTWETNRLYRVTGENIKVSFILIDIAHKLQAKSDCFDQKRLSRHFSMRLHAVSVLKLVLLAGRQNVNFAEICKDSFLMFLCQQLQGT